MLVRRLDHVGLNVQDLAAAKAFFLDLGLELVGEAELAGELLERFTGTDGAHGSLAVFRAPGGQTCLELVQFRAPLDQAGIQPRPPHALGMRHLAFAVEDLDGLVAKLAASGFDTLSGIEDYQGLCKLCYVRGPEGLIVELAES